MADSVTGVPVFLLADLKTIGAGANALGNVADSDTDTVQVRDRWNKAAAVAVSDAPGDLGDGNERVIYTSKSLNNVWVRQGAKIGTFQGTDAGPSIVVPE